MSICIAKVTITGASTLLQNNPQTVDIFNSYTRRMKAITAKKTRRTDDDYREYQDIEVRAKLFFSDDPKIGVFIPARWLTASIAASSFKVGKTSKGDIRGSLFSTEDEVKLHYKDMDKVKTPEDVVRNPVFRKVLTLKQGQVRVCKAFPIFHEWHFSTKIEFDPRIVDPDTLTRIIMHSAKYGGFGDFRPTYGRASAEVEHYG
jgi:hypothetical protein